MRLNNFYAKKRTSKIVDRLTYSPSKHKNKQRRKMRESLSAREPQVIDAPATKETLKFGSFNVNGLDIEARWAVEQLLDTRSFDVSRDYHTNLAEQFRPKSCL